MTIRFGSSSSINDSNETLECKSLLFSCIRSIKDGVLRFCHVAREEEESRDLGRSVVNRHLTFSNCSSNPGCYNFSNERPRLIHLIKQIVVHLDVATYLPHLSESEGLRLNDIYSLRLNAHECATSPT